MENNAQPRLLDEQKYKKASRTLFWVGIIVMIVGGLVGIGLIIGGILRQNNVSAIELPSTMPEYAREMAEEVERSIDQVQEQIEASREAMEASREEAEVERETIQEDLERKSEESQKKFEEDWVRSEQEFAANRKRSNEEFEGMSMVMIGGFVIFASFVIGGTIIAIAKRREIMAFHVQQAMPVAKEGIESFSPTINKAIGGAAEEIARGVNRGRNGFNGNNGYNGNNGLNGNNGFNGHNGNNNGAGNGANNVNNVNNVNNGNNGSNGGANNMTPGQW